MPSTLSLITNTSIFFELTFLFDQSVAGIDAYNKILIFCTKWLEACHPWIRLFNELENWASTEHDNDNMEDKEVKKVRWLW